MIYRHFAAMASRKSAFVAIACLICATVGQASEITSCWVTEPLSVDGQTTDWDSIPTTYLEDEGVVLGLCNDSTNVYVLFRFRDTKWLRSIRMTGLTLWLDAEGKQKTDFGVLYNGGPSIAELMELMEPGDDDFLNNLPAERRERMEQRMSGSEERFTVIYRGKEQPDAIPIDGSGGPAVGFGSSETLFTYEFAVPLQTSDYATFGMAAKPDQKISLGFEWGGRNQRDRGGMSGMGSGGRDGGRGGPPGGERMGGGRRGHVRMEPPEEHKFWVKTHLAKPNSE